MAQRKIRFELCAGLHAELCDSEVGPKKRLTRIPVSSSIAALTTFPGSNGEACIDPGERGLRKTKSDSKSHWDVKADRAIEMARSLPPGPARHDAMKKAGLLRGLAALVQEITRREKPVRGKKPSRSKPERSSEVIA